MEENLTLAVTTIGDLLFNKKITRSTNNKPIGNINLVIPDYHLVTGLNFLLSICKVADNLE